MTFKDILKIIETDEFLRKIWDEEVELYKHYKKINEKRGISYIKNMCYYDIINKCNEKRISISNEDKKLIKEFIDYYFDNLRS